MPLILALMNYTEDIRHEEKKKKRPREKSDQEKTADWLKQNKLINVRYFKSNSENTWDFVEPTYVLEKCALPTNDAVGAGDVMIRDHSFESV